jgi:hypothetical protein
LRPEFTELSNNESLPIEETRNVSINTIGLPIAEKMRSHSLNSRNDLNESMVQTRNQCKRNDSNSGINSQYSFCQQYSDIPPQPPPRRRSMTGGPKAKLEERLKHFHEEKNDKVFIICLSFDSVIIKTTVHFYNFLNFSHFKSLSIEISKFREKNQIK